MHKPAWEGLSDQHQAMLELACGEQIHYNYAETEANNPNAMNKMVEENGVQIRRWKDEELAALEEAWLDVLEEQSAADPTFKKVADSYLAFRENYKSWGEAQFLKSTYLGQ
jgi:TRAP-type mannitol/chloroaromatic compound transport system substrate-binding protein